MIESGNILAWAGVLALVLVVIGWLTGRPVPVPVPVRIRNRKR